MNIIPEEQQSLKAGGPQSTKKIIDVSLLESIGSRMVTKTLQEIDPAFRTKDMISSWRIPNILNAVDESTWFNMISACLDGQKKTLVNQQPNGDWQPCGFEFEKREDSGVPLLVMGVRWGDQNGGEDLLYQNGAPVVNVNVKTEAPQDNPQISELLTLLAQGQMSVNETLASLKAKDEVTEPESTKGRKAKAKS
jgi:hypothetical protein